jgi:hypothetical protein
MKSKASVKCLFIFLAIGAFSIANASNGFLQEDTVKDDGKEKATAKLIGKWQGDTELTKKVLADQEGISDEMVQALLDRVENISLEFAKDSTFKLTNKMDGNERTVSGTWSVTSYDEDSKMLKIRTVPAEGEAGEEADFEITFEENEKVVVKPGSNPSMGFKKMKSEEKEESDK